jgi:tellurite resistance protein
MIYVGARLSTPYGDNDPCLVDPSRKVTLGADPRRLDMGYWPSYSEISPSARGAYLKWLADGRSDPEVDVGLVFIFFYGLERRVIVDAQNSPDALRDRPAIAEEVRRLLKIYGERSASFASYANELLNWLALVDPDSKLYLKPVPEFQHTFEVPPYLRLALGQAVADGVPISAPLAMAWVRTATYLRTPAHRCPAQFASLFTLKYQQQFGDGLRIPPNKTKLAFVYRAASAGLRGVDTKVTFGGVPDVTVLTAPIKKLQELAESVTTELDAFSRLVGKNPDALESLEGLILLPFSLWPVAAQAAASALQAQVRDGHVVLTFQELLDFFGANFTLTKDKTKALARTWSSMKIGVEPDVLGGARTPKLEDRVVLFELDQNQEGPRDSAAYSGAQVTLQLGAAVALADGDFSEAEFAHLWSQIEGWTHLLPEHRRRLIAHLRLLSVTPPSFSSLKKKLEQLPSAARESIALLMATLVQADGIVSPSEVMILEKVYKTLGLDAKRVFGDVHAAGTPAPRALNPSERSSGFRLDPDRIAALHRDTERATVLLADIFKEDEPMSAPPVDVQPEPLPEQPAANSNAVLSLDEAHSSFARLLLTRPDWARTELLDVAADLELMLDGALEHINEVAFDTHSIPFTEGDDPVEVNPEIRDKLVA